MDPATAIRVESERPSSHDREEVIAFLDRILRPGGALSVSEDLPLLLGPDARSEQRVIRLDGRIAAHAAMLPTECKLGEQKLALGVIGAVATDPAHRGKGLASALVRSLVAHAAKERIPLVLLWSEAPGFYERLGFVEGGRETIHVFDREPPLPRDDFRVRRARKDDLTAMRFLHAREPSGLRRGPREWEILFAMPATRFHVLERQGRIAAYGVVGKGADLQGCIHEWGGEESLVTALVAGIMRNEDLKEIFVMTPPWKRAAADLLSGAGSEEHTGALAMLRINDAPALCSLARGAHRGNRPEPARPLPAEHDSQALVRALFGDRGTPPARGDGHPPFYLFGLDSM